MLRYKLLVLWSGHGVGWNSCSVTGPSTRVMWENWSTSGRQKTLYDEIASSIQCAGVIRPLTELCQGSHTGFVLLKAGAGSCRAGDLAGLVGKDPRAESWWDNLVVLPQAAVVSSHSPGTAACPCLVSVPQLPVPGACWGWVSPTATRTPVTCLSPAPRTSQLPCSYQKHLGAGDGSCCSGAGTQLVPLRLRGPAPACASWDFPPLL